MAILATIGGATRQLQRNASITWRLGGRGTADVVVFDPASEPQVGAPISIYEDGTRIWTGSIDDAEKTVAVAPGVAKYEYRLRCVSREYKLSYRLVKPAVSLSDPSSTYMALSGTVNVGGTSVLWVSGDQFDKNLEKTKIVIGGTAYTVASVPDSEHLTLTASAGSGTGIAFTWTPYAGNIVRSILNQWLSGEAIIVGTIEDGDDVGKQVYDYASVSDIFDRLAEASDAIWYISPNDELYFHARTTVTAATDITASSVIFSDAPSSTETREDLCNARYQRISYNAFDPDSATVPGDGTAKSFWIGAPIAVITQGSVQIGGEFFVAEFGIRGVDTGKDFYYAPGENKITQDASYSGTITGATNDSPIVVQTGAVHTLATGHLVYIGGVLGNTAANGWHRVNVVDSTHLELLDTQGNADYISGGSIEANQALDPGDYLRFNFRRLGSDVIGYADETAISARSAIEGTSGRYERIEESTDSVDSTGALNLATAIVNAKKATAKQLKLSTLAKGYQPGQLVSVTISDFGLSESDFLIEEISARDQEDGTFRYTLSLVDGQVLGGWRAVFDALRGTTKASSLAIISGGSVVGSGSSSGSGSGGTTVDPAGNVTITATGSEYYDWQDGNGIRLALFGTIMPPSPVGTFDSESVYWEKDASNLPSAVADGGTLANGSENAGGDHWAPNTAFTKRKHTDGKFRIDNLDPVAGDYRVYCASVNTEGFENSLVRASETGATPSVVITVPPISTIGATGEEYCKNPINCAATVRQAQEGAVYVTHVITTFDKPADDVYGTGVYVEVIYTDDDGNTVTNVGVGQYGIGCDNYFTTPAAQQNAKVRFRGFSDPLNTPNVEDDHVNSYAPGITPELNVTIGKNDGTVDLGEGIAATVAASMAVLNKVLGVSTNGITTDLIATFAVSQDRLANAQIIDAGRIVDDAVTNSKLGSLSVSTPKIADFAVQTAKIDNLAVDTTKIASAAITNAKIANLAVGGANIQDLAVSTAKIQDAAITTVKIQNAAITNALIANLAVATAHIQDLAVTDAKIAALSVGKLTTGSMTVNATTVEALKVTATVLGITVDTTLRPDEFLTRHSSGSYSLLGSTGNLELHNASSGRTFTINPASGLTASTASGGSSSLPSNPAGFITVLIDNTIAKIPYYNN